jgi:hypothetical protein
MPRDEAVAAAGTCQGLGERHHVGLDAVRLVRPQPPGAPQPALHLVKHQQRAHLVARRPQPLQELPAVCAVATRCIDRPMMCPVPPACMACSRTSAQGHLALKVRSWRHVDMGTLLPAALFPSCAATSDGFIDCVQLQDAHCVDELMPPSPCRGSTNTAAVLPFTMAALALSRSSYLASRAPPMSGRNGVLYCSCTHGIRLCWQTTSSTAARRQQQQTSALVSGLTSPCICHRNFGTAEPHLVLPGQEAGFQLVFDEAAFTAVCCHMNSSGQQHNGRHLVCQHQGAEGAPVEARSKGHKLAGRLCSLVIRIHARCAAHRADKRLMVSARGSDRRHAHAAVSEGARPGCKGIDGLCCNEQRRTSWSCHL